MVYPIPVSTALPTLGYQTDRRDEPPDCHEATGTYRFFHIFPMLIKHFASSHVALAPTTDIDESQTQPEESQISDTPCSIPTDYDPSGVTSQELDNIVITDAVTDFLKIFEEEEHTET